MLYLLWIRPHLLSNVPCGFMRERVCGVSVPMVRRDRGVMEAECRKIPVGVVIQGATVVEMKEGN